jgi:hypothetical protein
LPLFDLNPKESPKELFAREKELDELVRLIKARRWVAVLGPRMAGKTSLIKAANVRLEKAGFKTVYVNLWGARRTQGLLNSLARGLNSSKGLLQKIKDTLGRIEGVSFGPGGVAIHAPKKPMVTTWDILGVIGSEGGECVIELDEVQELAAISGHLLKLLANIFNTYSNVVFVFTGSLFGLMKTLLEPGPSSPLYGRSPARLHLQPFTKEQAIGFLKTGFREYDVEVGETFVGEAVEKLDGIPGWLTLYGNNIAVQRLHHKEALDKTASEGLKIAKDELEHYLEGRDRVAHISALKAAATAARWTEIKGAVEIAKGSTVNDATVYNVLESLKAAMLIKEEKGVYRVEDPMLRTLLLTTKLT